MNPNRPFTRSQMGGGGVKRKSVSEVTKTRADVVKRVAAVEPVTRKRLKKPTPPPSGVPSRRTSDQDPDETSTTEPRVASKIKYVNFLWQANLDLVDYYRALGLTRTSTFADVKKAVNSLSRSYKQNQPSVETRNTLDDILKIMTAANFVLTNKTSRDKYNQINDEKAKIRKYYNTTVKPLAQDVNEIYNNTLRIENNLIEHYEMNIERRLYERVYETIQHNIRTKHYKSTKTNRILVQWKTTGHQDTSGIDENYLYEYFKDDGLVGLVMCSTRPGCAVIELVTQGSVISIIERESKRNVFTVKDYTEAEYTADNTSYSAEKDKLNLIDADLKEVKDRIDLELQTAETNTLGVTPVEENESQMRFAENLIRMEGQTSDEMNEDTNVNVDDIDVDDDE
jgi:hypothetical protein